MAPDQDTDAGAKNIVSDPRNAGIRVSPVPFRAGHAEDGGWGGSDG
ncbi:hypothetical protein ASZ90_014916 [hydrocarbon metagenome]|uniref:Uncharacterized protein n=1 Tax=hydrocarbon metagenome TaxID=938273 RepID=A0A0W8F3M5_9ZZZZ